MKSRAYSGAVLGLTAMVSMAGGVIPGMARAEDLDAELLALAGEFELGNGDTKVIANRDSNEPYRVCVRDVVMAVPLEVTADDVDTIVPAGECATFNAKHIRVRPAGRLDDDTVLIGRFEHLKRQKTEQRRDDDESGRRASRRR